MSNVLDGIHRQHYQEQLQIVQAQLVLAEEEATQQRERARDTRLESEQAKRLALESEMKRIEQVHSLEIQKGQEALSLLQEKKAVERLKQLKRVVLRTARRTLGWGLVRWREVVQGDRHEQLRKDREKARQEASDQQVRVDGWWYHGGGNMVVVTWWW
jgi:hypothetical protein